MRLARGAAALFVLFLSAAPALARINLMTVPRREGVQLTIYNSADITLVRERRTLTLARGTNRLEFSWAGTLIDPTSVEFRAVTHAEKIEVVDVTFPGEAPNLLVWVVESEIAGPAEVEIAYFTSGITWASITVTLAPDPSKMELSSFVKVTNRSGECDQAESPRRRDDSARRKHRRSPGEGRRSARSGALSERCGPPSRHRHGSAWPTKKVSRWFESRGPLGKLSTPSRDDRRSPTAGACAGGCSAWATFRRTSIARRTGLPFARLFSQERSCASPGRRAPSDGEVRVFRRSGSTLRFAGGNLSKYIPMNEDWEIDLGEIPGLVAARLDFHVENPVDERTNPLGHRVGYRRGLEGRLD